MRSKEFLDVPTPSLKDLAKKHNADIISLKQELTIGVGVEMEHTTNRSIATEIALDHLAELPDYYTRLCDMEQEA